VPDGHHRGGGGEQPRCKRQPDAFDLRFGQPTDIGEEDADKRRQRQHGYRRPGPADNLGKGRDGSRADDDAEDGEVGDQEVQIRASAIPPLLVAEINCPEEVDRLRSRSQWWEWNP